MTPEFRPFPKMARLSREVLITEKIDGTNASVLIYDPAENTEAQEGFTSASDSSGKVWNIMAGSRTRWITPQTDNHGFARWVWENAENLVHLGPGHHFGEWWGSGIQRGYGLTKGDKRFSLFNVDRWCPHGAMPQQVGESWDEVSRVMVPKFQTQAPKCCQIVPVLYRGLFLSEAVDGAIWDLECNGSMVSPGFMDPEGVVIYHIAGRVGFKKTIKDDDKAKGAS